MMTKGRDTGLYEALLVAASSDTVSIPPMQAFELSPATREIWNYSPPGYPER